MVAVLNNGGGFYSKETYVQEIRKCGGIVHAPCINKSDHPNVIFGKDVYLGFGYLKELEVKLIQQILENRQFFGAFTSFDDFVDRISISIEQLRILVRIDAFRFTGIDKHELLWKAHFKLSSSKPKSAQAPLFKIQHRDFVLPQFSYSSLINAFDQMELLGFPLCSHFKLLENKTEDSVKAKDLRNYVGQDVLIYGNLITVKRTTTVNNKNMYFGTFSDEDSDVFDTVQFPKVAEKYPLRGNGIYLCFGKVVNELDYISINLAWMIRQETAKDPRLV